jgi:uncharacterized protein (TIGR02246 family)
MGRFPRQEIEEAFARYQRAALKGGTTGDWNDWADLFTADATYVEHLYGTIGGREAIRKWIHTTMAQPIHDQMIHFPVEWHMIDEEKGWVVCQVWNRMADPGDGSIHQEYNFTLLKYAGDGHWSYEEDVYNPERFRTMIRGWMTRRKELAGNDTTAR